MRALAFISALVAAVVATLCVVAREWSGLTGWLTVISWNVIYLIETGDRR